ncbi:hypothetical protein GE061_018597 [Apolygus lucorum]|uniref:Small nuclear ribonucleoprotein Sm D3 n=1 Tax=Apolygus lucorum TaxID=248454 RepID=A0A8S9XH32_APOLU|nr:hypothetical protein GE061_018597 [Apolygus lucorum]
MWCRHHNYAESKKLRDATSIFQAELNGIEMAVQHTDDHSPGSKFVIITDSQAAIVALRNLQRGRVIPIPLIRTYESLEARWTSGIDIKLQWYPSHVQVDGNERADRASVLAARDQIIDQHSYMDYKDLYDQIRLETWEAWKQEYWSMEEGPGGWMRRLKLDINERAWFSEARDLNVKTVQDVLHFFLDCAFTADVLKEHMEEEMGKTYDHYNEEAVMEYLGEGLKDLKRLTRLLECIMSIGVPIKVLHEAEGHIVTCETKTGEIYRGKLIEAEDNMNCQMTGITVTYRDGRVASLENVFIRGSKIRFLILPDMLKNAPMFKKQGSKGNAGGAGRGKSAILRAQAARGRGAGGRGGPPGGRPGWQPGGPRGGGGPR